MSAARCFEELECWQLARELKLRIDEFTDRPSVRRDWDYVRQIRDAARSAPRLIAEGFGRRTHADFARFLDMARGSLMECRNHIIDGRDSGYLQDDEATQLTVLAKRASGAAAALQRYLRRTPDP